MQDMCLRQSLKGTSSGQRRIVLLVHNISAQTNPSYRDETCRSTDKLRQSSCARSKILEIQNDTSIFLATWASPCFVGCVKRKQNDRFKRSDRKMRKVNDIRNGTQSMTILWKSRVVRSRPSDTSLCPFLVLVHLSGESRHAIAREDGQRLRSSGQDLTGSTGLPVAHRCLSWGWWFTVHGLVVTGPCPICWCSTGRRGAPSRLHKKEL